MNKKWKNSGLEIGTRVKISNDVFVEPSKATKRLQYVEYIGETNSGIILNCVFKPAFGARDPKDYQYRLHVNWANIYCGDTKIQLADGSLLRAKRIPT